MEALHSNYYGKIKSEKTGPKKKEIAPFCQKEKEPCRKRQRLLVGQTTSTISASGETPEQAKILGASNFLTWVLPLPLASLVIIFGRRPELNLTERDKKKRVAMRCFPREILTYCHRRKEVLLFHWFAVLSGVIISRRGQVVQ